MHDLLLMADPDELAVWALPRVCDMLKLNIHTDYYKASGASSLCLTCSAGVLSCHGSTHTCHPCFRYWHSQHRCDHVHTLHCPAMKTLRKFNIWTFVSWKMGVSFMFIQN